MSVDTSAGEDAAGHDHAKVSCGLCGDPASGEGRFLATYPAGDGIALSQAERDGLLALCSSCAEEVAELTDAWERIDPPAVAEATSIAESYRARASDCSFCGGAAETDAVLGIEGWSPDGERGEIHRNLAHYLICSNCCPIFAEFLDGIATDE